MAQKWADWHITPAVSGVPNASRTRTKSEVAHKWAHWLHDPCRLGGPQRFKEGYQIRSGPQRRIGYIAPAVGGVPNASKRGRKSEVAQKWANWLHSLCHLGGPQRFKEGDKIRNASGPIGYIAPAALRVPNASRRGTKSEVAHKWADWLHNLCRLQGPQCFKQGDKIRGSPQMGGLAMWPLPS